MRFKRRGFRRGTALDLRGNRPKHKSDNPTHPMNSEEFYHKITPLIRPSFNGNIFDFSESLGTFGSLGVYQNFSKEQQKNLTHKIAGQILYAHPDVVEAVFKRLSKISLDLSQQTEVAYRRLKLVEKHF